MEIYSSRLFPLVAVAPIMSFWVTESSPDFRALSIQKSKVQVTCSKLFCWQPHHQIKLGVEMQAKPIYAASPLLGILYGSMRGGIATEERNNRIHPGGGKPRALL